MRHLFARPSQGASRPWWQWSWLLLLLLILLLGISIWMLLPSAPLRILREDKGVRSITFGPNGRIFAASPMRKVDYKFTEIESSTRVASSEGRTDTIPYVSERDDEFLDYNTSRLAMSPDGKTLGAGLEDGLIRLWRVPEGQLLYTLKGHTQLVDSLEFSPDGQLLASTSWDKTIRLWRVSDGQLLMTLEEPGDGASFSPDGQLLVVGANPIRVIRVSDGSEIRRFDYTGVAQFRPDGQSMLIKATDDVGQDSVHVIRLSDGQQLFHWEGKRVHSYRVTFSPNGELIAIADLPSSPGMLPLFAKWGRIELWRVGDGRRVQVLQGHEGGVLSVRFSPDEQYLASVGYDGTVGLWRVAPHDPRWLWVLLGSSGALVVALVVLLLRRLYVRGGG